MQMYRTRIIPDRGKAIAEVLKCLPTCPDRQEEPAGRCVHVEMEEEGFKRFSRTLACVKPPSLAKVVTSPQIPNAQLRLFLQSLYIAVFLLIPTLTQLLCRVLRSILGLWSSLHFAPQFPFQQPILLLILLCILKLSACCIHILFASIVCGSYSKTSSEFAFFLYASRYQEKYIKYFYQWPLGTNYQD